MRIHAHEGLKSNSMNSCVICIVFQGDKDDIKTNISGLSDRDRDRMSPNAKKMLELIINDLRLRSVDQRTNGSSLSI